MTSPVATVSSTFAGPRVGDVDVAVLGAGLPVTVFAHGLGGSAAETRPLAARTPGTRLLLEFRGHGSSGPLPDGWDYDVLADDLLAVADAYGATRAVGLSLGCGALLRALTRDPDRFERVAFVLPATIDDGRADGAVVRLRSLGRAIDRGDTTTVTDILLGEVPASVRSRRGVRLLLERRAAQLVQRPSPQPRGEDTPVGSRDELSRVRVPALVLAQAEDPLHPAALAAELAGVLPEGELVTLPHGGVFWTAARQAQDTLAGHLAAGHLGAA